MPISLKMNSSSIDCVHKSFYALWSPELTESLDSSDSSQDSESSTYDTIFGIKKIINETLNRNILRKSKFQINGFNSNPLISGKYLKICFSRIKDLFLSRALWPFNPPLFSNETKNIKIMISQARAEQFVRIIPIYKSQLVSLRQDTCLVIHWVL